MYFFFQGYQNIDLDVSKRSERRRKEQEGVFVFGLLWFY